MGGGGGGGARSNVVGIICLLVELGLTKLPRTGAYAPSPHGSDRPEIAMQLCKITGTNQLGF